MQPLLPQSQREWKDAEAEADTTTSIVNETTAAKPM
jgi:hypothetical protein